MSKSAPVLGLKKDSNDELDASTLPQSFRTSWNEEEIGLRSKLVFEQDRILVQPRVSIWKNVLNLFLIEVAFCIAIGYRVPAIGFGSGMLGLIFLFTYYRSLKREAGWAPFRIANESDGAMKSTLIKSISGILVRENSNRRDDPCMVQIYLLFQDGTHELIRQELFSGRAKLFKEVAKLKEWLDTHS